MKITSTIKEYAQAKITEKIYTDRNLKEKEEREKVELVSKEIDKINAEARAKLVVICKKAGLDGPAHTYCAVGYPPYSSYSKRRHEQPITKDYINVKVKECLLKIEMEDIPKEKVKEYIDNYPINEME